MYFVKKVQEFLPLPVQSFFKVAGCCMPQPTGPEIGEEADKQSCTRFPERTAIHLLNFETYYKLASANNFQMLEEQYKTIQFHAPEKSYDVSQRDCNVSKNRHKNIYAFDDSRVVLQGTAEEDYINASYIRGYKNKRLYIASQGPTINTIRDFWRMIWEQQCCTVVMLCNTVENKRKKCYRYWPKLHKTMDFNSIAVYCTKDDDLGWVRKRVFRLTYTQIQSERTVTQFHFIDWPDKDVPYEIRPLIILRHMVNKYHDSQRDTPIIVHCSAGVGRTGSYIAMDILFDQLDDVEKVNVAECVLEMRESRIYMVQTLGQYVFVYKLIRWYILNRHNTTSMSLNVSPCTSASTPLYDVEERRKSEIQFPISGVYKITGTRSKRNHLYEKFNIFRGINLRSIMSKLGETYAKVIPYNSHENPATGSDEESPLLLTQELSATKSTSKKSLSLSKKGFMNRNDHERVALAEGYFVSAKCFLKMFETSLTTSYKKKSGKELENSNADDLYVNSIIDSSDTVSN